VFEITLVGQKSTLEANYKVLICRISEATKALEVLKGRISDQVEAAAQESNKYAAAKESGSSACEKEE